MEGRGRRGTKVKTYNVHRLTPSWVESVVTWLRDDGAAWSTPGGDFLSTPTASTPTGVTAPAVLHWNVASDVADVVAGVAPNNGWIVKDATEGSGSIEFQFASRENGTVTKCPQLMVRFTACP
jgi:hypothetical protein